VEAEIDSVAALFELLDPTLLVVLFPGEVKLDIEEGEVLVTTVTREGYE
jgi:hypothetical protein